MDNSIQNIVHHILNNDYVALKAILSTVDVNQPIDVTRTGK